MVTISTAQTTQNISTSVNFNVYEPHLFSLGYEGLSIDDYIGRLISNQIFAVVDVRNNPISRKPGFSKSSFQSSLENCGISYFHIRELGIPSLLRRDIKSLEEYQQLFDHYLHEIIPANLDSIERIKSLLDEYTRIALTCFEADYTCCHRHVITEFLSDDPAFSIQITHL